MRSEAWRGFLLAHRGNQAAGEAEKDTLELFELERLRQVFDGVPPRNAEESNNAVFEAVHHFAGDTPQSDDITCITLYRARTDG